MSLLFGRWRRCLSSLEVLVGSKDVDCYCQMISPCKFPIALLIHYSMELWYCYMVFLPSLSHVKCLLSRLVCSIERSNCIAMMLIGVRLRTTVRMLLLDNSYKGNTRALASASLLGIYSDPNVLGGVGPCITHKSMALKYIFIFQVQNQPQVEENNDVPV